MVQRIERSRIPERSAARRIRAVACRTALAVLGLVAASAAGAATIDGSGARIVEVTVYTDRAEVAREARLSVPAGASTIEFPGLPWRIEPDSVRVSAEGVPTVLGAVELRDRADSPEETPEHVAARADVERLEREIARLDGREQVAKQQREFLESIRASAAARESEDLAKGKADPAAIQAVYDLLGTNLGSLADETLARRTQREQLQKDLQVARARLAATRPAGQIRSKLAAVEVETTRAGTLTVRLEYLAPGAAWRPAYRASLDAASGKVHLVSEAVVRQRTGEDWPGVNLRLSTAAPARGVQPPRLTTWLLRPVEPRPLAPARGGMFKNRAAAAPLLESAEGAPDSTGPMIQEETAPAAPREAGIERSAYNVAFTVPGRSDVAADGSDHRVVLRQESLEGRVEYRTAPAAIPAAYLVARTKAPAEYPLLAGPLRVFAGGAYLGSFGLPETAASAEVTLPFGVDNRVTVERTRLPGERATVGIIGKDRVIEIAYRSTVENLRDEPVTLILEDRIPIAEDERIRVEVGKRTTPGYTEDRERPGVLEWKLDLPRGQKREIVLEYSVRFPKDLVVPDLD